MSERSALRRQREKRKIRAQILFVQWFFIVLFAVMCVSIFTYAVKYKEELFDNDYNGRQEMMLAENTRGAIYSSEGDVLARTVQDSAGNEVREYPYKNLFAHVVGYDTNGRSGIESVNNYDLVHSDLSLSEKAALDEKGEKYGGNEVYTSLDTALQQAASDALGDYKGAVIVTEPATGRILAMVSKPDFDPNTVEANWDKYLSSDSTEGVLLNRVTQGQYPPGSTFKIVDVIEYLEEHPDDWMNYSYTCNGSITVDGEMIHCYHWTEHGTVDLINSFAKSCNSSFANLGLSLDKSDFSSLLDRLMFEEELPFDYPYSESHINLSSEISTKEMMQLVIGQGENYMSPLHINLITQAVANGGTLMKPVLVDSVKTASGTVLKQNTPSAYKELFSSEIADDLTEMMRQVIEVGTASKLKGTDYDPAGKTGSAEFSKDDETMSHAWFTGFAPADDPQICVTVILEGAGSGGDYAVPVAKDIFDSYFNEK